MQVHTTTTRLQITSQSTIANKLTKGNIQQDLPPCEDLLFHNIFLSLSLVVSIIDIEFVDDIRLFRLPLHSLVRVYV